MNKPPLTDSNNWLQQAEELNQLGKPYEVIAFLEPHLIDIEQKGSWKEQVSAFDLLAKNHIHLGQFANGLKQLQKAIQVVEKNAQTTDERTILIKLFNGMGDACFGEGRYEKALEYFEKGLKLCQKLREVGHPNWALCYGNIGAYYFQVGDFDESLTYNFKALEIYQKPLLRRK